MGRKCLIIKWEYKFNIEFIMVSWIKKHIYDIICSEYFIFKLSYNMVIIIYLEYDNCITYSFKIL
jgi:hypothetical protein